MACSSTPRFSLGCTLQIQVKAVPGSSRDCIVGWLGEELKIRVSAPPEHGKANAAIEKLLAAAFDLPSDAVRVIRGSTSPHKWIEIDGLSETEAKQKLDTILS